jgi:hypothetical protein
VGLQGGGSTTEMSTAKDAKPFDPDLQPWERQPEEPSEAYRMFLTYRDMPTRNMALFDAEQYLAQEWSARKARKLSSAWSWGWRCAHFDRYMAALDVENLVRYRRLMNERHRRVAAAGFAKLAHWLRDLDVRTLTASEKIRLFELLVRTEQMAAGSYTLDQTPTQPEPEPPKPKTLADMLPGIDPTLEADLAKILYQVSHPDGGGHGQAWKP